MQPTLFTKLRSFLIALSFSFLSTVNLSAENAAIVETYLNELAVSNLLNDPTGDLHSILLSLALSDPQTQADAFIQLQPSWFADLDWSTENSLVNVTKIISNNLLARVREYRCNNPFNELRKLECNPPFAPFGIYPIKRPCVCVPFKNFWIAGMGGHLQQDRLQDLPAFRSDDWGIISGLDFVLAHWLSLGVAGGYTHTDLKWDNMNGTNSIHNFYIGPYAAWNWGPWIIDASLLKGFHCYRSDRHIVFGFINRKAKNTHYGDSITAHLGVDWNCVLGSYYNFSPYLTADYIYLHANPIKDKGAGNLDLEVNSHNAQFFQGEVGVAFTSSYKTDSVIIVPTIRTGFQNITPLEGHQVRSDGSKLKAHLKSQPGSFIVKTTKDPIYQWTTGLFVNFYVKCWPEFSLSYDGAWGNKRREFCFTGEVDWLF